MQLNCIVVTSVQFLTRLFLYVALAIKHADNITKGFALSISIVFTFLLSAILFDFKITWTAVVGAAAVISSTLLYEADEKAFQQLFSRRDSVDDRYSPRPPSLLKRWHCYFLVAILVTFGVAVSPIPHYSVSTAAWDLLATQLDINTEPPSIAIADMGSINSLIELAAVDDCHWGIRTHRQSTQAPYGVIPQASAVRLSAPPSLQMIADSSFYSHLGTFDGRLINTRWTTFSLLEFPTTRIRNRSSAPPDRPLPTSSSSPSSPSWSPTPGVVTLLDFEKEFVKPSRSSVSSPLRLDQDGILASFSLSPVFGRIWSEISLRRRL